MKRGIMIASLVGSLALVGCTTSSENGDHQLTNAELKAFLPGKVVTFPSGGRAFYYADGSYKFVGGRGGQGRYRFQNNEVCVQFTTGNGRCDRYFKWDKGYYLINSRGGRHTAKVSNI